MAVTGFAQEQPQTGDMIYVYLKGGDILPFQRAEITEFYYGFEDKGGVTYNEPVMQWIVLADSICKIPLANIDSISFVTPATVYRPGVNDLAPNLADYVVECKADESRRLMLYLSGSTPESQLPAVGSRVVLAEWSFAGDVASITREGDLIVVTATMVDLEEIFETYYATNFIDFEEDGTATVRNGARATTRGKNYEKKIELPAFGIELPPELLNIISPLDDDMPVEASFAVQVQPTFTVKASLVVNKGTRASINVVGNFDCSEQFKFNGKIAEYTKDFKMPKDLIDIPLGETFLFLYNRWGLFLKASAELDVDVQWQQHYRSTFDWSYNSKDKSLQKPSTSFKCTSSDYNPQGSIKGKVAGGVFTEIGVKFVTTDLAKAALRVEYGGEFVGDFVFCNKNVANASGSTMLYEAIKDSKIELNEVLRGTIQLSFLDISQDFDLPWQYSKKVDEWYLVPEFENTSLEEKYGVPTSAIGNVSTTDRKIALFIPVELGLKLFDSAGQAVDSWKSTKQYNNGVYTIDHQFDGLDAKEVYKVQPTVKILFFDLLANPEATIKRNPFPVRIVSFKQTASHYSRQQGYVYDNIHYFYKFNAATTVELAEGAESIKDWGYVYVDFYGEHKKISCANLTGRKYVDQRYAYYYNDPSRTVELYPYVQYEGQTEIQAGEPKEYRVDYTHSTVPLCPDSNHPHMIDLGLPSGTLWACCNVDANEPEDYGGHYAWGMTTNEKGDNYAYYDHETGKYEYIGSDIAGTKYDVAKAKWGGGWCMPTITQFQELFNCCQISWALRGDYSDGISIRLTASNGRSIILPAAGRIQPDGMSYGDNRSEDYAVLDDCKTYWDCTCIHYNYGGQYWSSSLSRSGPYGIMFRNGYLAYIYNDGTFELWHEPNRDWERELRASRALILDYPRGRTWRLSVRPVARQKVDHGD